MKHILRGVTLSYPKLVTPEEDDNGKLKYSGAFVIPDDVDISALETDAIEVGKAKWPKVDIASAMLKGQLRSPIRNDGVDKGYPFARYINARSEAKPGLVSNVIDPGTKKAARIADADAGTFFYPGAKVAVSLSCFAYEAKGNKGVSFGLGNLQFLEHGERLDGRKAAEDEFEALAAEDVDLDDLLGEKK